MSLIKQQNSKEKDISSKRRALIKGSAAAMPAILTLRSGASLAATSANCMERAEADPPKVLAEAGEVGPGLDTYLRGETSGRVLTPKEGGSPVIVFKHPDQTGDDADWYSVEEDTENGTPFKQMFYKKGPNKGQPKNKMKRATTAGTTKYTYPDTTTPCYVLCWVDSSGIPLTPLVYGKPAGDALAATESCMASALPTTT